jgi:leucyl aminopeptidase
LAKDHSLDLTVIKGEDLEKENLNLIYAVGKVK